MDEETCGQELARDADVPELLAELWQHVARNMTEHARWVGTETPAAAAEHDALVHIAREYRSIAAAAERAAAVMRAMHDLPAAPHDPSRVEPQERVRYLRRKIELQLDLAELLRRHAQASQSVLVAFEAVGEP